MSEDRMRAEFELWMGDFDFRPELEGELFIDEKCIDSETCGEFYYFDHSIQRCWVAWQASRAALEIDLPKPAAPDCPEGALDDSWMDGYHAALRMRESCVNGIEAAGVRVKK